MRERVRGYADGVLETAGSTEHRWLRRNPTASQAAATVAADLDSVARLLESSDDLAGALSDPGVPVQARRAVIDELFESQLLPASLHILRYLVSADAAPDFVEDVARLGRRAEAVREHEHEVLERPLGREAAKERLDGYATAVLAPVADRGRLEDVEDELFRFARIVEGSTELGDALAEREMPVEFRRQVVVDLLSDRATEESTRLAAYAVTVGRPRDVVVLLDALVERVAAETRRRIADVSSAVDLSEDERLRMGIALSRLVGYNVDVRVTLDRRLLGGFVATIGDTVVDGSVRHRLDQLKDRLVVPEAAAPAREGAS
jgi:F-type H+-transporting ATPase subunit delta